MSSSCEVLQMPHPERPSALPQTVMTSTPAATAARSKGIRHHVPRHRHHRLPRPCLRCRGFTKHPAAPWPAHAWVANHGISAASASASMRWPSICRTRPRAQTRPPHRPRQGLDRLPQDRRGRPAPAVGRPVPQRFAIGSETNLQQVIATLCTTAPHFRRSHDAIGRRIQRMRRMVSMTAKATVSEPAMAGLWPQGQGTGCRAMTLPGAACHTALRRWRPPAKAVRYLTQMPGRSPARMEHAGDP